MVNDCFTTMMAGLGLMVSSVYSCFINNGNVRIGIWTRDYWLQRRLRSSDPKAVQFQLPMATTDGITCHLQTLQFS